MGRNSRRLRTQIDSPLHEKEIVIPVAIFCHRRIAACGTEDYLRSYQQSQRLHYAGLCSGHTAQPADRPCNSRLHNTNSPVAGNTALITQNSRKKDNAALQYHRSLSDGSSIHCRHHHIFPYRMQARLYTPAAIHRHARKDTHKSDHRLPIHTIRSDSRRHHPIYPIAAQGIRASDMKFCAKTESEPRHFITSVDCVTAIRYIVKRGKKFQKSAFIRLTECYV